MTEAGSSAPRPLGLLQRAIGVITAPRATFESIVSHPRPFGILFLIALVIGLASGLPQMTESGRQAVLDAQIRSTEQWTGQPVSAEQISRMEQFSRYNGPIAIVSTFVFLPVVSLLLTAVYWALFNAILGGTASFKQVLAVVTHSQVIGALGAVIGVPIQIMQGTMSMGGPFNLGALAPMLEEGSGLANFLGAISVFSIWGVFVTAIGLAVLYRRKTSTIFIALLAVFLAFTAFFAVVLPGMFRGN
jgi:hypothetical protein